MTIAVASERAARDVARQEMEPSAGARLMVAFNGPQGARSVADELRRLGMPASHEIMFAVPRTMVPIPPSLRRRGRFVDSELVTVKELKSAGLFANEVARLAESWKADLLLVGSSGSPNLDPPYFACSAPSIAALAPCSVRVARTRPHGGGGAPRLVVGVDASRGAEVAVREVASRVWPRGAAVRLVTVGERAAAAARAGAIRSSSDIASHGESRARVVRDAISSALATLREAGLEASTELRRGDPVDELVSAARAWDADCILVGAGDHGDARRTDAAGRRLGAVAEGLVRRAPLSVEVVRERPMLIVP